ncbi:PAS domain S-box protein [Methanoregula sp.]|uniref:PAS domain S-box protein n=1 Tax=Methanoregula sp. TaxID=2052170 RepID=UPI00236FC1C5|nr:PAS domain S-box protein [Methanoregula sp.]MDD1686002.1 PAS domain S-box protein [Methanoregula sp.]
MLEEEKISRIRAILKTHTRGMTISDIASQLKMNRNSLAKYLEILLISGQVESRTYGTARVFFLSHRIPISAMLDMSSDLSITLNENNEVIFFNDNFLQFFELKREDVTGRHIITIPCNAIRNVNLHEIFSDLIADDGKIKEVRVEKETGEWYFKIKSIGTVFDDGRKGVTIIMEDITREKKYQLELVANEARYRGIVEDQTEFINRVRPDGTITFVNESFARFLGTTAEALTGTSALPFIFGDDQAKVDRLISLLKTGIPVATSEVRIVDYAGRTRWCLWTIRALHDGTGAVYEYQNVGTDITERKEATEKLTLYLSQMEFFSKKLEEFSELPWDADIYAAIGTGLTDLLPHAIVDVNDYDPVTKTLRKRAVFGTHAETFVTRCRENNFPWDDAPAYDSLTQLLASGKLYHLPGRLHYASFKQISPETAREIETELNLGDFYSIGLTWRGNLLGNILFILPEGETIDTIPLIELYARAASITLQRHVVDTALRESERKRVDDIIKNSENYLLKIFNSTQSGIAIIDPGTHTIFDINSTALEMIGCEKNAVIGAPCNLVFCPSEKGACPITDKNLDITRTECTIRTPKGERKPVLKTVVLVSINSRTYLLESFLDITKQKNAEDSLRADGERFRNLAEMLPQNVWECDASGKFTFVNNCGMEMYGMSKEDFRQDLYIWQTIHQKDRDRVLKNYKKAQIQEPSDFPVSHEFTAVRKDGSTFDTVVYHVPIVHEGKVAGMRGIGIDLSANRKISGMPQKT